MVNKRTIALASAVVFGVVAVSGLAIAQRFDSVMTIFFHGAPQLHIADQNGTWQLWAGGNFHIRQNNADRIFINGSNRVTTFAGPVVASDFQTASSRTGKTAIQPLGEAEARAALTQLRAVSYRRTDEPSGRSQLGFIAEDVPALLSTPARDSLSPMDFTAVTVTVLQAQQREIAQLRAEIQALKAAIRQ